MRLAEVMVTDSGVRRVNFNWIEPARMVHIRIDRDQESRLRGARYACLDTLERRHVGRNAALAGALRTQECDLSPAERLAARRYAASFVAVPDRRRRPPSALAAFVARLVRTTHGHTHRRSASAGLP